MSLDVTSASTSKSAMGQHSYMYTHNQVTYTVYVSIFLCMIIIHVHIQVHVHIHAHPSALCGPYTCTVQLTAKVINTRVLVPSCAPPRQTLTRPQPSLARHSRVLGSSLASVNGTCGTKQKGHAALICIGVADESSYINTCIVSASYTESVRSMQVVDDPLPLQSRAQVSDNYSSITSFKQLASLRGNAKFLVKVQARSAIAILSRMRL